MRRRLPLSLLACGALWVGCARCTGSGTTRSTAAPETRESTTAAVSEPPSPATAQGPAPPLRVRAEPIEAGFAVVLENRHSEPVRAAPTLRVEREVGSGWEPLASSGLSLRMGCGKPPPRDCLELVPGAELRPPPWLGAKGAAQCECADGEPAPPGRYRFVIEGCKGAWRTESDPFALRE